MQGMPNSSDRRTPFAHDIPDPSVTMPPVSPRDAELDSVVPLDGTMDPMPPRQFVSNPPEPAAPVITAPVGRTSVPLWGWGLVGMLLGAAAGTMLFAVVTAVLALVFLG